MTSRLNPRRSAHRRYMRRSISAQSCDSVPPGARVDGDDGVLLVVLAAEHLLDLGRLDRRGQPVERRRRDRWTTSSPWPAHSTSTARSASRLRQVVDRLAILLEPPAPLQHLLRLGLVLPEVGCEALAPRASASSSAGCSASKIPSEL